MKIDRTYLSCPVKGCRNHRVAGHPFCRHHDSMIAFEDRKELGQYQRAGNFVAYRQHIKIIAEKLETPLQHCAVKTCSGLREPKQPFCQFHERQLRPIDKKDLKWFLQNHDFQTYHRCIDALASQMEVHP